MRPKWTLVAAVVVGLLVSGCLVQSLGPFYTGSKIVEPPEVEGQWKMVRDIEDSPAGPNTNQTWRISRMSGGNVLPHYRVEIDPTNALYVVFFETGGQLLCDTTTDTGHDRYRSRHLASLHTLGLVTLTNDVLRVNLLDYSWFEKALTNGTLAMSWVKHDDALLVTQAGPGWKTFIATHGNDSALFSKDRSLEFRRAKGAVAGATVVEGPVDETRKVDPKKPKDAVVVPQHEEVEDRSGATVTNRTDLTETIGKYLAIGAAGGQLPTNFVVHISTHGVTRPVGVYEGWNFTPTSVERLGRVKTGTNWQVRAVAITNSFGIEEVCRSLVDCDFIELTQFKCGTGRRASGPFLRGTPYIGGTRRISVAVADRMLTIQKSCWDRTVNYDEAHEDRFVELYDTLKSKAPSPTVAISSAIATGAAGDPVPASFEVLIETFGSKEQGGDGVDSIVSEAWRYTPTSVDTFNCNVVDKTRQIAGLQEVCQALQAADFAELAGAKRGEDYAGKLVFDGTSCTYGWRYVRVTVDGQSQTIGEGKTWPVYTDEKKAQRFRELYRALRKIAVTDNRETK